MRINELSQIDAQYRELRREFNTLQERVKSVQEDGGDPSESQAVENTQREIQELLANIVSQAEESALNSGKLVHSREWVPSRSAFTIERDGQDVTITANEDVTDASVLVDGSEADLQFGEESSVGDTVVINDVSEDSDVEVTYPSTNVIDEYVELPLNYTKNTSNASLKELDDAPSTELLRRTHSVIDRGTNIGDSE